VLLSEEYIPIFKKFISTNKEVNKLVAISNPIESSIDNQKLKKKKILWVGRMTFAAKRPDRIVKIWERIWKNCEGWELYMLGDGDAKNILEKYCVDKNIGNIYFEGNVNPKIYYEEASILCMTSSYEGFGMVLVEALQNRVIPIVYNSSEVFNDIIKEGETGFLIKAFKNGLYKKKLLKLVNDEGMRSEIIKNIENDDIFERLSLGTIYNKWINLFNQL
jgi:glycosyltransferase involved in cell wall biosynthesis